MGYRLDVREKLNDDKRSIYCSKLYGYVDDETQLLSYKYLNELHKFDDVFDDPANPFFGYGIEPEIELTAEEFRDFMLLYVADLLYYRKSKYMQLLSQVERERFQEIYYSDYNKIITWW